MSAHIDGQKVQNLGKTGGKIAGLDAEGVEADALGGSVILRVRPLTRFNTASAVADPYVTPLRGFPYKLPDAPGMYRLLQDEVHGVVVNARVGAPSAGIQREILQAAGAYAVAGTQVPCEHYFFTELAIHSTSGTEESIVVGLEDRTVRSHDGRRAPYGERRGPFAVGNMYRKNIDVPVGPDGATVSSPGVCFDVTVSKTGRPDLVLTVMYSSNPQIRNGVGVRQAGSGEPEDTCTWDGLLADQCRLKFWTLQDMGDKQYAHAHRKSRRPTTNMRLKPETVQFVSLKK